MNIVVWVLQIILGGAFVAAGAMKLTQPIEKLSANMPWVTRFKPSTVRFIGAVEILGGLGVILPWALDIAPILTPIAAVGLALIMLLAAVHHLRNKEYQGIVVNAVLFVIALVIAIYRF